LDFRINSGYAPACILPKRWLLWVNEQVVRPLEKYSTKMHLLSKTVWKRSARQTIKKSSHHPKKIQLKSSTEASIKWKSINFFLHSLEFFSLSVCLAINPFTSSSMRGLNRWEGKVEIHLLCVEGWRQHEQLEIEIVWKENELLRFCVQFSNFSFSHSGFCSSTTH